MNSKISLSLLVGALLAFSTSLCSAQDDLGSVTREKWANKSIPVSMTGFSGEVDQVLRFDLEAHGFIFTTEPQYLISGKNNGNVEGRLNDALSKASLLSKAYSGGSLRTQAHTLANDIIFAITGKKGLAGTKIAYKVDLGKTSEIFVADYDGANAVQITSDGSEVAMPAWVPGQRKLLYSSWKNGAPYIFSHDLGSGSRTAFAKYPGSNYSPAVSPDGRKVVMILSKGGSPDLYVANIDGSGLQQLTRTRDDEASPCWSPDSSKICYSSRYGGRAALFTVSASGGEPHRLSVGNVLNLTEPDWSPDGKTLVFTAQMGSFKICTVPAGGGTANILAAGSDPTWGANSRTVIFTRETNHKRALSLLDVPTKRVKDITLISGSCSQPSWSK